VIFIKVIFLFLILVLLSACAANQEAIQQKVTPLAQELTKEQKPEVRGETMRLASNDFVEGGMIPRKFTCQGDNINPHLAWETVPEETKSFALIVDDPDAPMGTWVHWLVKDIPADVREIQEGEIQGNQVKNDFGKENYGGPCPPSGTHRYYFRLFALDTANLSASNKKDFYKQAEQHTIGKVELMGKYKKN